MSQNTRTPPDLSKMLARYLERQGRNQEAGLSVQGGDVTPFEAVPVQPVEPRLAWDEARTALTFFQRQAASEAAPPEWSALVAGQEPAFAVAFAAGNYPQLVRDLHRLLQARSPSHLQPSGGRAVPVAELPAWADEETARFPNALLALGALRLARLFDQADELVAREQSRVPADWQDAWGNERAALLWHQGHTHEAHELWRQLPGSAPVLFNRGMSALFLDRHEEARGWLNQAVAQIPDDSAWHHLGRLYLALAEMRNLPITSSRA